LFKGTGKEAKESYIEGISSVLNNCKRFLAKDYCVFIVANDKHNLYPTIADKAGMKIVQQFKRPVLNRSEKDKNAYSETIFHLKEKIMDDLNKELIALQVIKTLYSRFENFPEDASDNRNAPFHEAFLEAFKIKLERHVTSVPIFVSLASWMHGLNTSIGQSFFERTAQILCDGEKESLKTLQLMKINKLL